MSGCQHHRRVNGVEHFCEREEAHGGEHVFAFTAGQLKALLHELTTPSKPRFPVEALPLVFAPPLYTLFSKPHDVAGWVSLVIMASLGWRWCNIWQAERKGSSRS